MLIARPPRLIHLLRMVPFTVAFVLSYVCMFLAELLILPGGIAEAPARFGISVETLADHQYWRMVTALIVSRDSARLLEQIAFIAVMIGVFERSNGSLRAIGLFVASDVAAKVLLVPLLLGPLGPILSFGVAEVLTEYDVGMSVGGMALLAAGLHRFSAGWRAWAYLAGMAFLIVKILVWHQPLSDLMHLMTFNFGWLLASVFRRNPAAE